MSLRNLTYEKLEQATGQSVRETIKLQQGIPTEKAKELVRLVKDSKNKSPGEHPRRYSQSIQ